MRKRLPSSRHIGVRVERLLIIDVFSQNKATYAYVKCDCGVEKTIRLSSLVAAIAKKPRSIKSCGCFNMERRCSPRLPKKNAKTRLSEYYIWNSMKQRCFNTNCNAYKDYGARGITMCDRWKVFENFYADMGERPSKKHSIDRIDNNSNYEPGNCRWATAKEQGCNRRNTLLLTFRGKAMTVAEFAQLCGRTTDSVYMALRKGKTPKQIFDRSYVLSDP